MTQEKIKIRKGVFETNSSSMHSICFDGNSNFAQYNKPICGRFDEFGWGYDILSTAEEKLSYVLTYLVSNYNITKNLSYKNSWNNYVNYEELLKNKYFIWLNEIVKDYTGFDIHLTHGIEDEAGYIDHQSMDTISDHWSENEDKFKTKMKELIFNQAYEIIIDHDNH